METFFRPGIYFNANQNKLCCFMKTRIAVFVSWPKPMAYLKVMGKPWHTFRPMLDVQTARTGGYINKIDPSPEWILKSRKRFLQNKGSLVKVIQQEFQR